MKQQVNLYQAVLQPIRERLGLKRLLQIWLCILLVLFAAWLYLQQQQAQLTKQLASEQQQLNVLQQEMTMYQQALAQRQPSAELVSQYDTAAQSVAQKQQLLNYLSQQQQQATQIYSPVLQHLQHIDRQDLWLTGFSLQQHFSSFNGIALRPDSVPLWLENLRQLAYFRGQRFSQVNMLQVPEKKAVSFELRARQGAEQ